MQTFRAKYRITNKQLARIFGYKTPNSLNSSTGKDSLLKSVDLLIALIEDKIIDKIKG